MINFIFGDAKMRNFRLIKQWFSGGELLNNTQKKEKQKKSNTKNIPIADFILKKSSESENLKPQPY